MILLLMVARLSAEPVVWWTEESISARSELFGKAQARDAQAYELAQTQLAKARRAVGDLELADALLPPDAARARYLSELDRSLSGQFLRLQRHTDLLGEDYARSFGAAVQRGVTLVADGRTVVECTQVSAVERAMGKGPRCPGTDISAKVAATIDKDLVLAAEVTSLLSVDWPSIAVSGAAQPLVPLLGTARSVSVASVARALRKDELRDLNDAREAAMEQISEELSSPDRATKEAAIKKGEDITAAWRMGVATLGAKIVPELKKKLEKGKRKGAPVDVALCVNPEALGGCGVPDATAEAIAVLAED